MATTTDIGSIVSTGPGARLVVGIAELAVSQTPNDVIVTHALGSCIAVYVHQFFASRGLPHAGLRVEVTPRNAANPNRIAELVVQVCLPTELPPHVMEMLERVVRSCPVHNTLAHGAEISVAVGAGDVVACR